MKKKLASILLASSIIFGGAVVTAQPAQAMSYTSCYNKTVAGGVWGVMLYEDYSWFEEVFQGKHDRWVWKPWQMCV